MRVKGCLSAIDGLVVKIRLPNGTKSAITYLCYQDYYALNTKAHACPDGEFLDINVGRDGATGSNMILNKVDCGKNVPTTILSSLTATFFLNQRCGIKHNALANRSL